MPVGRATTGSVFERPGMVLVPARRRWDMYRAGAVARPGYYLSAISIAMGVCSIPELWLDWNPLWSIFGGVAFIVGLVGFLFDFFSGRAKRVHVRDAREKVTSESVIVEARGYRFFEHDAANGVHEVALDHPEINRAIQTSYAE